MAREAIYYDTITGDMWVETPNGSQQPMPEAVFLAALGVPVNPLTNLGDVIYAAAAGVQTRLGGNTTTTRKFLRQIGTGSASAAPTWEAAVPGSVTNGNFVSVTSVGDLADSGSKAADFATAGHNHDLAYTTIGHNHDEAYEPLVVPEPCIADPTGGATVDTEAREAIVAILDLLVALGFMVACSSSSESSSESSSSSEPPT